MTTFYTREAWVRERFPNVAVLFVSMKQTWEVWLIAFASKSYDKHPDWKQPREQRVYFTLWVTVHQQGKLGPELKAIIGRNDSGRTMLTDLPPG